MEEKSKNLYLMAKEISKLSKIENTEAKIEKIYDDLSEEIYVIFNNGDSKLIENAIIQSSDDNNIDAKDILADEAFFEIENMLFEKDGKDIASTMLLLPLILTSKVENITLPSINQIEKELSLKMVQEQLIKNSSNLKLGTVRISQKDIGNFTLQDWWNLHHDIISEFDYTENEKFENEKIRNLNNNIKINSSSTLFYLVVSVLEEENNVQYLENIFDSSLNSDFWANVLESFSSGEYTFTLLPPLPIRDSVEDSLAIMETINFEQFFYQSTEESDYHIIYMKIKNTKDKYSILFFDPDTYNLHRVYYFNTHDDNESFICNLVELCLQFQDIELYSTEEVLSMQQLENWRKSDEVINIKDIFKKSNKIDLLETQKFCGKQDLSTINNKTFH